LGTYRNRRNDMIHQENEGWGGVQANDCKARRRPKDRRNHFWKKSGHLKKKKAKSEKKDVTMLLPKTGNATQSGRGKGRGSGRIGVP